MIRFVTSGDESSAIIKNLRKCNNTCILNNSLGPVISPVSYSNIIPAFVRFKNFCTSQEPFYLTVKYLYITNKTVCINI